MWPLRQSNAVNFDALVAEIKAQGGFSDYELPSVATETSLEFKFPSYPGELSYGNGPINIELKNIDLPQTLIDAQRHSVRDAINHYIPQEKYMQWAHMYFSGDFLASTSLRSLVEDIKSEQKDYLDAPPDEFSMRLNAKERKRTDRAIFTKPEQDIMRKVCAAVPSLAIAVLAYQASYIEYLSELSSAITKSPHLTTQEKQRGMEVVRLLDKLWGNTNFIYNILPAVAVHYYQNHKGRLGEPATEADFTEGMRFASQSGVFDHHVRGPKGDTKVFSCPARGALMRGSAVDFASNAFADKEGMHADKHAGVSLFHVYREVEKQITNKNKVAMHIVREVRNTHFLCEQELGRLV